MVNRTVCSNWEIPQNISLRFKVTHSRLVQTLIFELTPKVNQAQTPFNTARVSSDYCQSRIEELSWLQVCTLIWLLVSLVLLFLDCPQLFFQQLSNTGLFLFIGLSINERIPNSTEHTLWLLSEIHGRRNWEFEWITWCGVRAHSFTSNLLFDQTVIKATWN